MTNYIVKCWHVKLQGMTKQVVYLFNLNTE